MLIVTNTSLSILGNTEITAINQGTATDIARALYRSHHTPLPLLVQLLQPDPLGVQGVPALDLADPESDPRTASCWYKKMSGGAIAAILLNTGDDAATIKCELSDLTVKGTPTGIRDLWKKAASLGHEKAQEFLIDQVSAS